MANPLIRTLNGWRFELPLALVLGASAAFATIAMPDDLFATLPGVAASGYQRPIQIVLAVLVAVLAAVAAYAAMKRPAARDADEEEDGEDTFDAPPIDIPVRLRRADAHPDFPPREPIRASRDLGEPFMKIRVAVDRALAGPAGAATDARHDAVSPEAEPGHAPAEPPAAAPTHAGDLADIAPSDAPVADAEPGLDAVTEEIAPETPADPAPADEAPVDESLTDETLEEPAPAAEDGADAPAAEQPLDAPEAVTEWPLPRVAEAEAVTDESLHPTIAAFGAEADAAGEPAPRPERPRRESLAEMMERLADGLDRRVGRPVAPPPAAMLAEVLARPRAARPDMREALDELKRLAGRRD